LLGEAVGARVTIERLYGGYAQYAIVERR